MKNVYDSVVGAGIDVHYKFSTVALVDVRGRVVRREGLDHPDREALRRRLSQWPAGMTVVMEASFGWGWLSDLMEEVGLKVRLSNCYKVDKMRDVQGLVKTNDKDAALLAPLPMEGEELVGGLAAPKDVRDRREWMRHRMDLVSIQTAIKCRIHAIFHRHGIFHEFSDLFGGGGRMFLAALCQGQDEQSRYLSCGALEALRDNVLLLGHLRGEMAQIAIRLRKELEHTPAAQWVASVPGFGLILAHVVLAEIGQIGRFRSSRALAAYSLLAPRANDTGEAPPANRAPVGRHLGQRGNRTLKWAFIEAAHGAVRHGGPLGEMFKGATEGGRKNRGRGYIKVARALVEIVYAVLRDQRKFQERRPEPPKVAMRQSKEVSGVATRPGTGRPYRPMVAAGQSGRGTSW